MSQARGAPLRVTARLPYEVDKLPLVFGAMERPALLESARGFGRFGRWSVFAAGPRLVFEATGSVWSLRVPGSSDTYEAGIADPLGALAGWVDRLGLAQTPVEPAADAPPFVGGLIGHLGYDLAPQIESLPRQARRDSRFPDVRFGLYDQVAVYDHLNGALDLWAVDFLGEGPRETERRLASFQRALALATPRLPRRSELGPIQADQTRASYLERALACLEYIAAGDVFQVNLSQRFVCHGKPRPLDLYLALRAVSPAPFAAYLAWDDLAILSASPESFYETRGDRIVTRPIKGTRPRGATPEGDEALLRELRASPKDRAELTMIVDLERNDLGRVCKYGSVLVSDAMAVESFAQVHHLVATVEGRLRPNVGPIDVVRALFPGGSITGAPKIRAMQIIDELEPTRRGPYTGVIGYLGLGGSSAFNIAIRTLLVEGDRVSYQVGGGIVADSRPEAEYEETLHKGAGLRRAIETGGAWS